MSDRWALRFGRGRIEHVRKRGQVLGHHRGRPKFAKFIDNLGMASADRIKIGRLSSARLGGEFVEKPNEERFALEHRRIGIPLDRLRAGGAVIHGMNASKWQRPNGDERGDRKTD